MINEKVLQSFKDYVGIKLHFNEPSFLWNPNSGSRITIESVAKRKDLRQIIAFSRMHKKREDQVQYLISCYLNDPSAWIGDIVTEDHKALHNKRMKSVIAQKALFDSEIENIIDFMKKNSLNVRGLLLTNGSRPAIIEKRSRVVGGITDETLALLDYGFKYLKQETNDPLWRQRAFLLSKYKHLIEFNKDNLRFAIQRLAATEGESPRPHQPTHQQLENKICHLPI